MRRGEIWFADLSPVVGNEQAGKRPVLIVSVDYFNECAANMVIVVPLTKRDKGQPLHVPIEGETTGLRTKSFIKTEDIRSIAKARLIHKMGAVDTKTMGEVETRLKRLLGL